MYINLANIDFGGEGGKKAVLQETTIESLLTETTKVVTPPEGVDGFNKVTVTHAPVETLTEATITSNGETTITPSAGFDATFGVKVIVDVTTPLETWVDVDGMKYSTSTIANFPDTFRFSPRSSSNCAGMFTVCSNLISITHFDTSNATDMSGMFLNCSSLTSVPMFDTSSVTNMSAMFYGCKSLTSIPLFNTSKVNDMSDLFFRSGITGVPQLDTSSVTNMASMFNSCSHITSVPSLNTQKVTNVKEMFYACRELKSVGLLDLSNATNTIYMFYDCNNLTTLDGLTGLKDNIYLFSPHLTHDSLLNVINGAADVTASPKTLTLGATNLAKLTDEEKAIATSKGWTLA